MTRYFEEQNGSPRFEWIGIRDVPERELGPGHTIVTILCDSGTRYRSKLFNAEFLWKKKLPYPDWIVA